jgi:diamine N-acetyltransferase
MAENKAGLNASAMRLVKTREYHGLDLHPEQVPFVCSAETIQKALVRDNCIGFYAYEGRERFGFALLREFETGKFFLWDFIIDIKYQRQGKGKAFLMMLILSLRNEYNAVMITTTYIYNNEAAKRLYENLGFVETDTVDEDGIHEVNMELRLI